MASYRGMTKEEEKILKDLRIELTESVDWCDPVHSRVEDNNDMVRGEQWSKDDAEKQAARERPALPLNSLLKLVNAVANREIMDRIAPFIFGRNEEDNGIAEGLQAMNLWQRDTAETEHEESLAFRTVASSGYGVMHKFWVESALDGHGLITDEAVPVWLMLWDPRARRQNLVDRKYHICGKYIPVDDVVEQWGDYTKGGKAFAKHVRSADPFGPTPQAGGNPVRSYRGTWGDVLHGRWFTSSRKEVFVIEREWVELKNIWKLASPINLPLARDLTTNPEAAFQIGTDANGNPIVFDYNKLQEMIPEERAAFFQSLLSEETEMKIFDNKRDFDAAVAEIESYTGSEWEYYRRAPKQVYRYAIVCNDYVLEHGDRPMGFTYEFMTGFPHETKEGMDWFGMVDVAKGAQDFKNKFFSNMLTLYMLSPKQQIMIEEGAVGDTDAFMNEFGKLGGVTFVPDGFLQSGRFTVIDAPRFPPMLSELLNYADQAVMDVFGLSSIEMGQQGDLRRVSGNVVTAARQASNTMLASLFDALRRYRRRWGMLSVKFVQQNYDPQSVARIIGEEKNQYVSGITDWGDINRFDVRVDEQPTSVAEQMETVDLLTRTDTLWKWESEGKLTFPEALDLLVTIPQSKRDRIKKNYEARMDQQKQFQEQMSQMQAQMGALAARLQIVDNVLKLVDGGQDVKTVLENQFVIHEQIMPVESNQQ